MKLFEQIYRESQKLKESCECDLDVAIDPEESPDEWRSFINELEALEDDGVYYEITSLNGPGGGWPNVYIWGDPDVCREFCESHGYDFEDVVDENYLEALYED